ncbi:hypothetical protein [Streptomyces sp. NBC_00249]|uniref:effector-associated constant component EACC1 n=1 Tax=Streptomyces sp. NBC_00249 TaxID=2975690 RepID=UPI0033907376
MSQTHTRRHALSDDGGGRERQHVEAADELRSLHNWLQADTDVRRSSSLTLQEHPPEPGQMGGLLDVIQLVSDNGWSAASFVVALAAWKRTRPQDPRIEIRRARCGLCADSKGCPARSVAGQTAFRRTY